eukprot:1369047-Pyramimonas_sp.AAC.1
MLRCADRSRRSAYVDSMASGARFTFGHFLRVRVAAAPLYSSCDGADGVAAHPSGRARRGHPRHDQPGQGLEHLEVGLRLHTDTIKWTVKTL